MLILAFVSISVCVERQDVLSMSVIKTLSTLFRRGRQFRVMWCRIFLAFADTFELVPHVGVLREAPRAPAEGGARTVWCDRSVRNVWQQCRAHEPHSGECRDRNTKEHAGIFI